MIQPSTPADSHRRHAAPSLAGWVLYTAATLAPPPAVASDDLALFSTTNQNPFIQIYSLPSPSMYSTPGTDRWAWSIEFDLANGAIQDELPSGERLALDGETYRTSLMLRRQVSARVVAGLNVPFVAHSGGFLDSFVRDWHDVFGLSNSRRDDFEDNSLDYSYASDAGDAFRVTERSRGLGDIRLTLDHGLDTTDARRRMGLRAGLKLPTGAGENLHGSGSTDVSLQLLATDAATLAAWNTTLAWMIGGMWLGDGEVLDGLRRDLVAVGSVGLSRQLWRNLTIRLQLDGHSSFYDTDLDALGAASLQLSFGGSIALAGAGRLDLVLVENLFTDTTPDLVLHLAWRGGF